MQLWILSFRVHLFPIYLLVSPFPFRFLLVRIWWVFPFNCWTVNFVPFNVILCDLPCLFLSIIRPCHWWIVKQVNWERIWTAPKQESRLADVALSPFLIKLSLNHVFEEILKLLNLLCHVNTGMLTKQFVLHHIIQFKERNNCQRSTCCCVSFYVGSCVFEMLLQALSPDTRYNVFDYRTSFTASRGCCV